MYSVCQVLKVVIKKCSLCTMYGCCTYAWKAMSFSAMKRFKAIKTSTRRGRQLSYAKVSNENGHMLEQSRMNNDKMSNQKWIENEMKFQKEMDNIKINYKACTTVTVTVLRGRNISVGLISDKIDTPDAQVYLKCNDAVGKKRFKTKIAENSEDPEWNESFTFILSESMDNHVIAVDVYEEDMLRPDPHLGSHSLRTQDLEIDKTKSVTVNMGSKGEIDIELLKRRRSAPDFRLSHGLSEEERKYRTDRKRKTMEAIQRIIGKKDGPTNLSETPTIAVAITGGGYRAVAASCGAMEAFAENNLIDTLMYIAGLSGSSWYLSSSYFRKSLGNLESMIQEHDLLREKMRTNLATIAFDELFYGRYCDHRVFKRKNLQPTTFVDLYGMALGKTFLGEENMRIPFSSLRDYVKTADVPFPILSCALVRDHLPMSEFWDEVEMTPFEISLPSYGINIRTELFNSIWRNGILQQSLPEPPLHFLMGASGSAFAIMLDKIFDKNEIGENLQKYILRLQEESDHSVNDESDNDESDEDEDNFASVEDEWIELVRNKTRDEVKESLIGRNFALDRTAKVRSCAKGYHEIEKFTFNTQPVSSDDTAAPRFRKSMSTMKAEMSLCDSALGCNLPSIHIARPQRTVDVLIVVDCSNYGSETSLLMEIFATTQSQVYDHGIKFPRISVEKVAEDPFREFYLFEDLDDPDCPVVLWFTLSNDKFKKLKNPNRRPGYPKPDAADSGEEIFNEFMIYPEISSGFGTLQTSLTSLNFDRIRELMRYNIVSNMEIVKKKIAEKVKQMRARN